MIFPAIANTKICGITDSATAQLCERLGFGAVGFVFFGRSPRCISPQAAGGISATLGDGIAKVGVFVDMPLDEMLETAREARLSAIQLHGSETPEVAAHILDAGYKVIRAIRNIGEAASLPAGVSVLLECGRGTLPGGNGAEWDWSQAAGASLPMPLGIAGGLRAGNVVEAMDISRADACDISSGAESAPGVKDHAAIAAIAHELANVQPRGRIFWRHARR